MYGQFTVSPGHPLSTKPYAELCTRLLTLLLRDQTVTEETGSHLMAYHATVGMLTASPPSHSHAQQVAAPVGVSVLLWVLPWVASLEVSC